MITMGKSLLVLGRGDSVETDKNRIRLIKYAAAAGFEVQAVDYHNLVQLHRFKNDVLNVLFFFPYTFWNKNCEVPDDTKLYGTSKKTYFQFKEFLLDIQDRLEVKFSSHDLIFATSLKYAAVDRDKLQTIRILNNHGLSTSETISYAKLSDILLQVTPKRGIFIKCRYGAEGKGITLIKPDRWVTNYKVENGRLANYGVYDRWNFTDITGRKELLEQLIEHEVIVEREIINPNIFGSKKFDLRIYVADNKVPHFFVRINELEGVITNWSQGSQVIHHPETGLATEFIESAYDKAKKAAGAFHSRLAGVDIMLDKESNTPQIIELQSFTGFPDIEKFNLARYLVDSGFFH